ncbi:MAG: hypothetical protein Q4G70_14650 [Pseudomonadota bacterium]|nr:hypothetical protein [Pseudomonadota bacterium]
MPNTCLIFFRPGKATLETASKSLEEYGLTVDKAEDHLVAYRPDSPSYIVRLVKGSHVLEEATEIGAGTEHAVEMSMCSERFEIEIENLSEALDEINTLMEVQGALQDASDGYLFLPWNGSLSKPW